MTRLLILLALAAITYGVITPGPPDGASVAEAATASSQTPFLMSLEPMSLAIGLIAGIIIGWVWRLPWGNLSELFRELALRSVRGFGLMGLAMAAAALLLFY